MTELHTPEPWRVQAQPMPVARDESINWYFVQADGDKAAIASAIRGDDRLREANARRIVACVNACAGIPIGFLENGLNGQIQHVREAMKQRDELLDSLEWLLTQAAPEWETESGVIEYTEACKHARSVISSVKGGAV